MVIIVVVIEYVAFFFYALILYECKYATALLYFFFSSLMFFPPFDFLSCYFFITRFLLIFTKQLFLIFLIPSCYGKHLCSIKLAIYYDN